MSHLTLYDNTRLCCELSTFQLISGAAKGGYFDLFVKLYKENYFICNLCHDPAIFFDHAVISGNIQLVEWMLANGFKLTKDTIVIAAFYNKSDLVKWLYNIGCSYDYRLCREVVCIGNLELLKWLNEHNMPLDNVCYYASYSGQLEILLWAIEIGCEYAIGDIICKAIDNRHVNIIKWLRDNKYLTYISGFTMDDLNNEEIEWLNKHGATVEFD